MIDFNEMVQRQNEGEQQIQSLDELERDVLKHFCSLGAEALLKLGSQRKAPIDEVVVNAFRNGIALGLGLTISNREVRAR